MKNNGDRRNREERGRESWYFIFNPQNWIFELS